MAERKAQTFGQLMAEVMDEREISIPGINRKPYMQPIRNRQYRLEEELHLYAERTLIRFEFHAIWQKQKSFPGELAKILSDDLKRQLDDPTENETWRHRGILFGQRRTYWNTGTLGRCDLEPSDRRCPLGDMFPQEFRVLETVNNIRIQRRGEEPRPLINQDREKAIATLRNTKPPSA